MVFSEKELLSWWLDQQMKLLTGSRSQNSHFTSELLHHSVDPFILSDYCLFLPNYMCLYFTECQMLRVG